MERAELLLDHGKVDVAAGRAYYALFYIAEALLNEKGLQFSAHGDVIGAYGKQFSKTNLLAAHAIEMAMILNWILKLANKMPLKRNQWPGVIHLKPNFRGRQI